MSERPYVPFYKPYGMTDEEYQHEVSIAERKLAEWEADQEDEDTFQFCDNCDLPDACQGFGCAIKQGLKPNTDF